MINIVTWDVGAIGVIQYTLNKHDRDIITSSKPIKISSLFRLW